MQAVSRLGPHINRPSAEQVGVCTTRRAGSERFGMDEGSSRHGKLQTEYPSDQSRQSRRWKQRKYPSVAYSSRMDKQ